MIVKAKSFLGLKAESPSAQDAKAELISLGEAAAISQVCDTYEITNEWNEKALPKIAFKGMPSPRATPGGDPNPARPPRRGSK